ncbi:MAG: YeiH family protein [Bacteroidia bacterium]
MTKDFKKYIGGLVLTSAIALVSFLLSSAIGLNAVLIALLLGILIGNLVKPNDLFTPGIKKSSGLILELSIILMAFGINYKEFLTLGWETILIIVFTIIIVLAATIYFARKFNCPGSTGWLVGFGTAICGSSAIAALAPSVSKDKTDVGIALAVVNLYGLAGMILLPLIARNILTNEQISILLGGSLHSMGNVAGAGFGMNEAIGELSVTVKLGRIALLTPALLIFRYLIGQRNSTEQQTSSFSLPWYLIAFIAISVITSFIVLPESVLSIAKQSSSFLLAIAMAAIGLKVSFTTLLNSGKKGLIFGAVIFSIQLIALGALMYFLS